MKTLNATESISSLVIFMLDTFYTDLDGTPVDEKTSRVSEVSIAVIMHHDQKQHGEKRVYFILTTHGSHSISEGSQGRNTRKEPRGRN